MKKLALLLFPLVAVAAGVSPQALLTDPVRVQDPSHMTYQHKVSSYPEYPTGQLHHIRATNGECYLDRPCTNFTYVTYMRQCTPEYYDVIQTNKSATTFRIGEGLPVAHILLTPQWSSLSSHTDIVSGDKCEYAFTLADLTQIELESDGTWSMLNAVTNVAPRVVKGVGAELGLSYFTDGWTSDTVTNLLVDSTHCPRQYKTLTLAICTDHDTDVTVGNWERSFAASSEIQVVQLSPEPGSGAITVATDPSATVYLRLIDRDYDGIMHLHMALSSSVSAHGISLKHAQQQQQQQGDLAQYAFHVAISSPTSVCVRARGQWDTATDVELTKFRLASDAVLQGFTLDRFEKGAGVQMIFPIGGMYPGCKFECYGTKIFPGRLLSLGELDDMYDKDKKRIAEKYGDEMSWKDGGNLAVWDATYETKRVSAGTASETVAFTDPGSGASGVRSSTVATNAFEVIGTVHSGIHNIEEIRTEDVEFSCPSAVSVDGNVLRFSENGSYLISATDAKGIVKTASVHLSGGSNSVQMIEYLADDTRSLHYKCTRAVLAALASASNNGTLYTATAWNTPFKYYKWQCKRLPVLPVSSTAGSQGHRSMAVLSPHTYYSANHYGWWVGGTETYVSEDNSVTSVVKTTSSMVRLSDWALANGFTSEEVSAANIGDIVVGRFTQGTVDDSCVPYILAPSVASNYFGTAAVPAWRAAQNQQGQGLPVLVEPSSDRRLCSWKSSYDTDLWTNAVTRSGTGSTSLSGLVSLQTMQEVRAKIATVASTNSLMFARTYPGDSGLGVYLDDGAGNYILLSHHHFVGGGPSYTLGHEIVKAWIISNGDTPKVYIPEE